MSPTWLLNLFDRPLIASVPSGVTVFSRLSLGISFPRSGISHLSKDVLIKLIKSIREKSSTFVSHKFTWLHTCTFFSTELTDLKVSM